MTVETSATEAEEFSARMLRVLNSGMLALLVSIGHRTRLFEVLASSPPATAAELAEAAGLDERYVREWLGGMTIGRVVVHDPVAMTFWLPPEHVEALKLEASMFANIGILAQMEDHVVECFRHGGGIPFEAYPERMSIVTEETKERFEDAVVEVTLSYVPGIVGRLEEGIDVLDVGCGTGHDLNTMAKAFPASRFVGLDISARHLAVAREQAGRKELTNVIFVEQDAVTLDSPDRYDFITSFDSVHDLARPDLVLSAIARSLRPGGTYLCVDVGLSSTLSDNLDHPGAPFIATFSCMHCIPLSMSADGGMGLGSMWGEQLTVKMLNEAGFSVEVVHPEDDWNNFYIATKPQT